MGLLNKAKEELADEAAEAEKKRIAGKIAAKKALEDKKEFLHAWFLRLKNLIEEGEIKIEEVSQGWSFACLLRGEKIVGYFQEVEESGSEYVSDYGCDVSWYNHELVFSPHHYLTNNSFFSVSLRDTNEEVLEKIAEKMVAFYKAKQWV